MSDGGLDVLFVGHDLAGGGAERVLVNLVEGMVDHEVRPRCLFFGDTRVYDLPASVPVRTLGLIGGVRRRERILALAGILREEPPDVVVSFLHGVNLDVALAHRVARSRARLILTEHNVPSLVIGAADLPRKRRLIRRLYRRAAHVVCVSRAIRDDLADRFGVDTERMAVVPNPIDVERTRAAAAGPPPHPWCAAEPPVFVNVASLKARKGHHLLLGAFRRLRAHAACRLLILGEGPLRVELEDEARRLGVAGDVAFLGFVTDPFRYMARAAALVVASSCEGFPNVILEAMACGTPVISTPWLGVDDIIEDSIDGVVVPQAAAASRAAAMASVIDDAPAARRRANAARRTVERFATARIVPEYLRLFAHPV